MSPDLFNSLVTFIVGLLAFAVYFITKRHEKRNAATIITMDIRQAEQVVSSILETNTIDHTMKNILSENNWAKYKHLFAGNFSHDDFAAFNRFFEAATEMENARNRMAEILHAGLTEKAAIFQQKIFNLENLDTPEGQTKKQKIIEEINREVAIFDPHAPKHKILQNLHLMGRLSNTVAFEKLKRLATTNA